MAKKERRKYSPRQSASEALKRLRRLAREHKLTAREISDLSGINYSTVHTWLSYPNGDRNLKHQFEELINMFLADVESGTVELPRTEEQLSLHLSPEAANDNPDDHPLVTLKYQELFKAHEELKEEFEATVHLWETACAENRKLKERINELEVQAAQLPLPVDETKQREFAAKLAEKDAVIEMYRNAAYGGKS